MRVAQRLYENGHITYMRTDSTTLSESAIAAARAAATQIFGAENVSDTPRQYARKVKNAQEAHEAIRPSGDVFRTPGELAREVSPDELALYDLIWKRTVASQMSDARGQTASVRLGAVSSRRPGRRARRLGHGHHPPRLPRGLRGGARRAGCRRRRRAPPALDVGRRRAHGRVARDRGPRDPAAGPLHRGDAGQGPRGARHRPTRRPTPRRSRVILDRGYVFKKGTALVPTWLAFAVTKLLEQQFGDLVDYDFTAQMESDLDRIADGEADRSAWLHDFYFGAPDGGRGRRRRAQGPGRQPGRHRRPRHQQRRHRRAGSRCAWVATGPYIERGEERASVPEDLAPDELTVTLAEELLAAPSGDHPLGPDPASGLEIVAKTGRYGPYVTEVLPEGAPEERQAAHGFAVQGHEPRHRHPGGGAAAAVAAAHGRGRPCRRRRDHGAERPVRPVPQEGHRLALDRARGPAASRSPSTRPSPSTRSRRPADGPPPRRRCASSGADPVTGKPIVIKDGRFGAYVTDGETNATLRKADTVEGVTVERAAELLAEKRAAGPAKKGARRPAKKTATKTAKKTAKKTGRPRRRPRRPPPRPDPLRVTKRTRHAACRVHFVTLSGGGAGGSSRRRTTRAPGCRPSTGSRPRSRAHPTGTRSRASPARGP